MLWPVFIYAQHSPVYVLDPTLKVEGLTFDIIQDQLGFMWFGTDHGLFRYDGYDYINYQPDPESDNSLSGKTIQCLLESSDGSIWIGTQNNGLNRLDPRTQTITKYTTTSALPLKSNRITDIAEDSSGYIWVATQGGGLHKIDPANQELDTFNLANGHFQNNYLYSLFIDAQGHLWVGSDHGLCRYRSGSDDFILHPLPIWDDREKTVVTAIHQLPDRNFLVGTQNSGLFVFHADSKTFSAVPGTNTPDQHNTWAFAEAPAQQMLVGSWKGMRSFDLQLNPKPMDPAGSGFDLLDQLQVRKILYDRSGLLWIATSKGVYLAKPDKYPFDTYQVLMPRRNGEIRPTYVNALASQSDSLLWMGTSAGLTSMYLPDRTFLPPQPGLAEVLKHQWIETLYLSPDGDLWISSIDQQGTRFRVFKYEHKSNTLTEVTGKSSVFEEVVTRSISSDSEGRTWFGTWKGLVSYEPDTQQFRHHVPPDSLKNLRIQKILVDDDRIWLATFGRGIYTFNKTRRTYQRIPLGPGPHNQIEDIILDDRKTLWMTTPVGLGKYDINNQQFELLSRKEGSNDMVSVAQGPQGDLWIGMNNAGLLQFQPTTGVFKSYTTEDGIQDEEFRERGVIAIQGDQFIFCGNEGFTIFQPTAFQSVSEPDRVHITEFQLFNQPIAVDGTGLLRRATEYSPDITLQHHQKVFTLKYAAIDFANPEDIKYAYQLDGFDQDWQPVGSKREVTFTNLDPGTYRFRVKAYSSNLDNSRAVAQLQLVIRAPWWETTWFYALIAIATATLVWFIYRLQLRRRLAIADAARLKDLDELRNTMLTNITHEFRTPLTVILGLAEKLKEDIHPKLRTSVNRMEKNGHDLLDLVNQMLDLRRIDEQNLELSYSHIDLVDFCRKAVDNFSTIANQKSIRLTVVVPDEPIFSGIATVPLSRVIGNIMSNALKHTPNGGQIEVNLDKFGMDQWSLDITDSGPGISPTDLAKIFNRFYTRTEQGTGIGLAYAKELVTHMGGNLSVKSRFGEGAAFRVVLPIKGDGDNNSIPISRKHRDHSPPPRYPAIKKENAPTLLIVEDNKDLQHFLMDMLSPDFQVSLANDGHEGWAMATDRIPDLIISDVVMPGMNGFELCDRLKKDKKTSHIPIILLTARVEAEARISGFRRGADAYINKPFSKEELRVRIDQILAVRQRLQAFYLGQIGIAPPQLETTTTTREQQLFLAELQTIIQENLEDENLSVDLLARRMGLSQSQLHRKMKALTGASTHHFIRNIKLQNARYLLKETSLSIQDIAFQSGFSSTSYFAKVFSNAFRQKPTDFRKNGD